MARDKNALPGIERRGALATVRRYDGAERGSEIGPYLWSIAQDRTTIPGY
jgi:hypothetical protein